MALEAPATEITAAEQPVLCRRYSFSELRSHQIAATSAMSAGYDCLLTVSTGGGKNLYNKAGELFGGFLSDLLFHFFMVLFGAAYMCKSSRCAPCKLICSPA